MEEKKEEEIFTSEALNAEFLALNSEFSKKYKDLTTKIEHRIGVLAESETRWSTIENKIETNTGRMGSRIKLDVGGKIFSTTKETLLKFNPSYFSGLISNLDRFKPMEDGCYLIDRNPIVFDRVLDYLRTGKLDVLELSPRTLAILKDDFDYYCMEFPNAMKDAPVAWDVNKTTDKFVFSDDNLTATSSILGNRWYSVIGDKAVDRFTIKINQANSLMIGFITSSGSFDPNSGSYLRQNSWMMHVCEGRIYGGGTSAGVYNAAGLAANGDYVTVIREGTTIRFEKNKVNLGVCNFSIPPPNQPLFPVMDCFGKPSATIIHDY